MTSESTLCNDTITSNPDKAATEKEKQLLDKMKVGIVLFGQCKINIGIRHGFL